MLSAFVAAILLASAAGVELAPVPDAVAAPPPAEDQAAGTAESKAERSAKLRERWGVEIVSIRATARGRMIDFRYRVLDSHKAAELFERKTHPFLVDQETGKVLAVPRTAKVGPLRNSDIPIAGKIYWMFFDNVHQVVKPGSVVDVVIGEFRAGSLEVQ